MRNSVVLRLASAAVLSLMAGSVMTSPAAAFVGLSDKQAAHIEKFIKCKTYLLKWDLTSFDADPDCGKGPVVSQSLTYGEGGSGHKKHEEECYPTYKSTLRPISECPVPE